MAPIYCPLAVSVEPLPVLPVPPANALRHPPAARCLVAAALCHSGRSRRRNSCTPDRNPAWSRNSRRNNRGIRSIRNRMGKTSERKRGGGSVEDRKRVGENRQKIDGDG